jgi:hypothetical protein
VSPLMIGFSSASCGVAGTLVCISSAAKSGVGVMCGSKKEVGWYSNAQEARSSLTSCSLAALSSAATDPTPFLDRPVVALIASVC